MRSYMKDGRCTICGAYRTKDTLKRFQEAVDIAMAQILATAQGVPEEITIPTECCPVPDYISLREFATAYYGKIWYRNPRGPWSQGQLQAHFEEVIFISQMYHLYRFGNYTDLKKYFADYDNGDVLVAEITNDVLPAYRMRAIDPDSDLGKQENPWNELECAIEIEMA